MQTQIPAQQAQQKQSHPEHKSPESAQPQFEDARPEAAAQLRMQSLMASSAQTTQLKSTQAMMAAKPNNTGLPNQLKAGIENLSGISMDNVKVHYNSDKPAQLQAQAYAQGSEIHVAPGQEQHLPHEAWHVVQQAQGRVKLTMQMKGDVPVNDDEGLEKEADVMGAKALESASLSNIAESPAAASFGAANAVQRAVSESSHANDANRQIAVDYENALNEAVQRAHHHVIAAPNLGPLAELDGHTAKWVEDWRATMQGNAPGSLATSFGYAIETLATMVYLPADPGGTSHQLQGVRHNTRPDVILINDAGDVAWLDITASASGGHIWNKAGWDEQPHVSEVTYPSLAAAHRQLMAQNNDAVNPVGFNADAFAGQLTQARALRDFRRQRWADLGVNLRDAYRELPAVSSVGFAVANLNRALHRQNPLLGLLINQFNLGIDPPPGPSEELITDDDIVDTGDIAALRRMAPHILSALNLGTQPFGFVGGGQLAGEAWLLHNDPNLAQPADLPQEVDEADDGEGGGAPQQAVAAMEE